MKGLCGRIAALLALITVLSLGLTALCGIPTTPTLDGAAVSVMASFYPMYIATRRVAAGSDGVTVSCLTQPSGGCLHDYQLSPAERVKLDAADVLVLNGSGAEEFLSTVLPQLSATVVDTTAGLFSDEHTEHTGHAHSGGEHAWMQPEVYGHQVECIAEALCAADPANADVYRRNAETYTAEIDRVTEALSAAALDFDGVVVFHESMTPLAKVLQLPVLGELPLGEDTVFSASEVAAVAEAVRGKRVLFLYDNQYPTQFEELLTYAADGRRLVLGSAVRPIDGADDVWVHTMNEIVREVTV